MLGHVPGCEFYADAVHVCEEADPQTLALLANLAGTTIADLQRRRLPLKIHAACPANIPDRGFPQRRCWLCPVWNKLDATPF